MTRSAARPYALRNCPRSALLPRDVLDALSAPAHHRQGQIIVWAPTAAFAYECLKAVGLDGIVSSARQLGLAQGRDVEEIHAAQTWPAGTVLATNDFGTGLVVQISPALDSDQRYELRIIGEFASPVQVRSFRLTNPPDPEITDAMVHAALDALDGNSACSWDVCVDAMRAAIIAALRVQQRGES